MNKILATLILLCAWNAGALTLHCNDGETPVSCANKVENALEKLGCKLETAKTKCTYSLLPDPKDENARIQSDSPYCEITSSNCSSSSVGNFGGETCYDNKTKVSIARQDQVHNGYWFGWFGSYSRTVCITK